MSDETKRLILKAIGSKFYIGFLTLCLTALMAYGISQMEMTNILGARITGGIAVLPFVHILRQCIKTKADKLEFQFKLDRMEKRTEDKKIKYQFKLNKIHAKKK